MAMSRIAAQTALYRKTYNNGDLPVFVAELASLLPQLERMGYDSSVPESHKATILLASIPVKSPLETTAAALRTKDMSELTWASLPTILIDEHIALKPRSGGGAALSESGGRHGRVATARTLRSTAPRRAPPTVAAMTTKRRLLRGRWMRCARWKPPRYHCLRVLRQAWPRAWELLLQPEQSRQQTAGQDARTFLHCSRRNTVC
jgi:hypothetical protein